MMYFGKKTGTKPCAGFHIEKTGLMAGSINCQDDIFQDWRLVYGNKFPVQNNP
jgi:hypothetical protein